MTKSISCSDAGSDCKWSATSKTEENLMGKIAYHIKFHHKEIEYNTENLSKIRSLIKETSI